MCIRILKDDLGVTAVVNAAQGSMSDWNYVNTKESYYAGAGIDFLGIPAIDLKHYPINTHFTEACDFIDKILKKRGEGFLSCSSAEEASEFNIRLSSQVWSWFIAFRASGIKLDF